MLSSAQLTGGALRLLLKLDAKVRLEEFTGTIPSSPEPKAANVFNTSLGRYQDTDPLLPRFAGGRLVFGRITLQF
jgi:hypothetical protein